MAAVTGATPSLFRLSLASPSSPSSGHKIERKLCILPLPTYPLERPEETQFPISAAKRFQNETHLSRPTSLSATLGGPKGFGPSLKKTKKTKKPNKDNDDDEEEEEDEEEDPDQGVIPEVVTNRMISRMGFTVGTPLFIGLLFFPFFYYLKVGLKIDVPSWVPFIVSFFFFGSALLGVSYGIVSSSWDPLRKVPFWDGMRLRRTGLFFGNRFVEGQGKSRALILDLLRKSHFSSSLLGVVIVVSRTCKKF